MADLHSCHQISDAAFAPLAGHLKELDISQCTQLSDAAFVHFRGIKQLKMLDCPQRTITDAAFAHLAGIEELDMTGCNQDTPSRTLLSCTWLVSAGWA